MAIEHVKHGECNLGIGFLVLFKFNYLKYPHIASGRCRNRADLEMPVIALKAKLSTFFSPAVVKSIDSWPHCLGLILGSTSY